MPARNPVSLQKGMGVSGVGMKKPKEETKYKDDRNKSRKDMVNTCEIGNCSKPINDIHHINSSYRGRRTHNPDGSDLIGLCRKHHEEIHAKNKIDTRMYLLGKVANILYAIKHPNAKDQKQVLSQESGIGLT